MVGVSRGGSSFFVVMTPFELSIQLHVLCDLCLTLDEVLGSAHLIQPRAMSTLLGNSVYAPSLWHTHLIAFISLSPLFPKALTIHVYPPFFNSVSSCYLFFEHMLSSMNLPSFPASLGKYY